MHFHPRMIGYFLETSTVRITESDGSMVEPVLAKGTIGEAGPWAHEIENLGDTPLHSLIVEFKSDTQSRAPRSTTPDPVRPANSSLPIAVSRLGMLATGKTSVDAL